MSSERKNTGLRVALASYDVHQLRVWHQYIAEQSAEILCSEYRSGEELLQSLKQGRNTEVVVLGGPLEDMDSREFLERMSRLPQKPLLAFPAVWAAEVGGRAFFLALVAAVQAVMGADAPFTAAMIWAQIRMGLPGLALQAVIVPALVIGLSALLRRDDR